MATTSENLRDWLMADSNIAPRVATRVYDNCLVLSDGAYIWFQLLDTEYEDALDDSAGAAAFRKIYSVECWSELESDAETLGNLVQAKAHLFTGTFGDATVKRIFAPGQSADYEPQGQGSQESWKGHFLRLEIVL